MKISAVLAACLVMAGCMETAPRQQAQRPTAADDPSTRCFDQLENDDRFAILKPHFGAISRANQASIEQLASTARPTEDEKRAISVLGVARQTCASLGTAFRAAYAPPGWVASMEAGQSKVLLAMAKLYGGDYTYGQIVPERQQIAVVTNAQLQQASNADSAARNQQAQQEAARANQALQMFLLQQQANRPVTTSCNRFMNTVNCTTR